MFDVIQADLEVLESVLEETVVSETALVTHIGTYLISSGGKRLRPALFLLAARGLLRRWSSFIQPPSCMMT